MAVREDILKAILMSGEQGISGETLCASCGISRAAVWKHIKALEALGYIIEGKTGRGYRILSIPDRIDGALLDVNLKTQTLGRVCRCLDQVDSTNRAVKRWAMEGAPHGALVVADEQSEGRGRKGRVWQSPKGEGLWFSLLLRPKVKPEQVQSITLLMAVAVAQAVERCCPGLYPKIKWPNDVLVNGRKLCGILTELSADMDGIDYVVPGIGINCQQQAFPEPLSDTATSLKMEGYNVRRMTLCAEVMNAAEALLEAWEQGHFAAIASAYRQRMAFLNEKVTLTLPDQQMTGEICGVNDEGHLLLRDEEGQIHQVFSGEVTVRRQEYAQ